MNVTMKVCTSDNNELYKSFGGSSASFDCVMKDGCSVFDPVILIGTSTNITGFNYASISDLGREYFVKDIVMVRANLYQVQLHVDVLSTYASELAGVNVVARRSESKFNMYLDDNDYPVLNKEQVYVKKFSGSGFTKDLEFVLAVAG